MTKFSSYFYSLLIALTALLFSPSAFAALDDTCSGATTINLNTSYARTLSPSTDWYKVSASAVGQLKVNLSGPSGSDFDLYVYSSCSSSTPLGSGESSSASEVVQFTMTYSGYYYIKVVRFSGSGTGYGLSATVVSSSVDSSQFSSENYPDGTQLGPNTNFTKTWTLYNNGSTTWNSNYYIQYQSGSMSQTSTKYISGSVPPGYSYTFSVPMKTPSSSGTYTDYWSFKSPSGTTIKVSGSNTIWAQINVVGSPNLTSYTPSGWDAPIIGSFASNPSSSSNVLYACQNSYFKFGFQNNGNAGAGSSSIGVYVDNSYVGSLGVGSANAGWTYNSGEYTMSPKTVGNHTVKMVLDVNSNVSESNEGDNTYSKTFYWDNCPPSATITTNSGNSFTTGSSPVTIQGTCSPTSGDTITNVKINNTTTGYSTSIGGTNNFTFNSVPLTDGSNSLKVTCSGAGSQMGQDTITVTLNSKPTFNITTNGGNNFSTTQGTTTISGTCTDPDSNIDYITFQNLSTGWSTTDNGASGGNWSFNQTIPLQNGNNNIFIECWDVYGKSSGDGITVTSNQYGSISGTVTNGSGSALSGATVQYSGPQSGSATTSGSGQYSMAGLSPGTYSVMAKMSGYYDSSVQNVSVSAGNTSGANFSLTKLPAPSLYYSPNNIGVTMNSGSVNGTQSFIVKNTGDATLTYTPSSNVNWASIQKNGATITGASLSLAPSAQDTLTVTFNSNGITSSQSGTITLTHNDSSQGAQTISLGMGINAPPPPPPPPAEQPAPTTPAFQPALYGSCQTQNACYSDPVNTAIGNYTYSVTDLEISARGPSLEFTRYYNSLDTTSGPLGIGWNHSLNSQIITTGNGDAYIRWGNGRTDLYVWNGNGFTRPAGVFATLTKNSQYVLTDKNQNVWVFSLQGKLLSIKDRHNNGLTLNYDSQSRLTSATNAVGDTLTFAYISSTDSKLASVTDFTGRKIQFAYSDNLLTQTTDARGNNYGFVYDQNRLSQITERDGVALVINTYDSSGRVTFQKDGIGNQTEFKYNFPSAGQTTIIDPENRTHVYSYDALYRLISHTGPGGNSATTTYNTSNQITQWTDANGKTTSYTYDANGNLASLTDPLGATMSWTYDELDRVQTHTSALGLVTTFTYDTTGNVTKSSFTLNGIVHDTIYTYAATGELTSVTNPLGDKTTYGYSAKGELDSVTNALTQKTSYAYDSLHRRTSASDPISRTWSYQYDGNDNLKTIVNPLNQTETITIDARDRISSVANPVGTTTYTYDSADRVTQTNSPDGTTTYAYNKINQRTSVSEPSGATTAFNYSTSGYLNKITDPTGRAVTVATDPMGNVTSTTNAANKTTLFTLNDAGQPTVITDPANSSSTLTYNTAGLITKATDPASNSYTTAYDGLGRIKSVTNPLAGALQQSYDKNGQLSSLTTPAGTQISWKYDNAGRISEISSPTGKKRSFTYDAAGQLTGITNPNAQSTTIEYDGLSRPTKTTFADGVIRSITYNTAGRPTQVTEAGRTRSFTYDTANRITSTTEVWGKTIGYSYNNAGRVSSITYPGNKTVSYTYDTAGRMTSVTDVLGNVTSYTYDSAGRLQQTAYPSGIKTAYAYDNASRVTSITHKKSDGTNFLAHTAAYNSRGDITSIDVSPEPTSWLTASTANYTTNSEDQYTQVGSELIGYDAVGQLLSRNLSDVVTNYTFDARERLTAVSGTNSATFIYGPLGERIQKTANGVVTRYVVDTNAGLPRVLAELDSNNTITAYYIYGIGLLARVPATNSDIRYYHEDHQSNVVALSKSDGTVSDTYFYHPFGKVLAKTGSSTNPYQYAGLLGVEQDETGLLYMRARYYDPALGRFVSKDPLGVSGGDYNLYAFARNSPYALSDPSGMWFDIVLDVGFVLYDVYSLITEPSWTNAAALGLDVVGAVVPFATGLGTAYKATKSVPKAIDVYQAERKLTSIATKADNAVPFTKNAAVTGTKKHSAAKEILLNEPTSGLKFTPEQAYDAFGNPIAGGKATKSRIDVVLGDTAKPDAIFDYKFGKSGMSKAQTDKYKNLFPETPIIEIRPQKGITTSRAIKTGIIGGSSIGAGVSNLITNETIFTPSGTSTSSSASGTTAVGGK